MGIKWTRDGYVAGSEKDQPTLSDLGCVFVLMAIIATVLKSLGWIP